MILIIVEKPRKNDVLEWLVDIDASWRGIGLDLGVSNNDLDGLAESNKSNQTKLPLEVDRNGWSSYSSHLASNSRCR